MIKRSFMSHNNLNTQHRISRGKKHFIEMKKKNGYMYSIREKLGLFFKKYIFNTKFLLVSIIIILR